MAASPTPPARLWSVQAAWQAGPIRALRVSRGILTYFGLLSEIVKLKRLCQIYANGGPNR
jgi:hypothetical protein